LDKFIVVFKGNRKGAYIKPSELEIKVNDYVVVQAERGEDYGQVISTFGPSKKQNSNGELQKITRLGNDSDHGRMKFNRLKEKETFEECLNFIQKHQLKM